MSRILWNNPLLCWNGSSWRSVVGHWRISFQLIFSSRESIYVAVASNSDLHCSWPFAPYLPTVAHVPRVEWARLQGHVAQIRVWLVSIVNLWIEDVNVFNWDAWRTRHWWMSSSTIHDQQHLVLIKSHWLDAIDCFHNPTLDRLSRKFPLWIHKAFSSAGVKPHNRRISTYNFCLFNVISGLV